MRFARALFIFIVVLAGLGPSHAAESFINNNQYGVIRSRTLVDVDGKIQVAQVLAPRASSQTLVVLADRRQLVLNSDQIAITTPGSCWKGLTDVCVSSTVRGYFPISGDTVVQEGRALKRRFSTATSTTSKRSLLELASLIPKAQGLRVQDFLQVFGVGQSVAHAEASCANAALFGRRIQLGADGYADPHCMPKVLYSWGPKERTQWFESVMGAGRWTKSEFPFTLFGARSPSATFGYGSLDESGGYSMRIELAPGVRYKFLGVNSEKGCSEFSRREIENTVYVRVIGGTDPNRLFSEASSEDFFVCSAGPIRSWSFGTRRDYDELVLDLKLALSGSPVWEPYTTARARSTEPFRPIFLDNVMGDAQPFTQAQLINSLRKFLWLAARDEGAEYVNPRFR